jgi:polyhydroxyalkanoate synthesis regulator phasin
MLEQLKKDMFIGIGLMAMTKDRIMEFGKKLAEDSKLSEDEGKKLVDDLLTQADDMKKYFEKNFSRIVEEKMKNVKLPCNEGFEKMGKEINEMKETLARIESKLNK